MMLTNRKNGPQNVGSSGSEYLSIGTDFRTLLADYFVRSGMSYAQLADAVHRDVAYVHRLVNGGRSHPSPNTVIRLALGLRLSVSQTDELLMAAGHAPLVRPAKSARSADSQPETLCES